jgi:hypothetical protein
MSQAKIYIHKLKLDKYYVGKTARSVLTRLAEHNNEGEVKKEGEFPGAKWTRLYGPVQDIVYVKEVNGEEDEILELEDYFTINTMFKYGLPNVRGGQWCKIELTIDDVFEYIWARRNEFGLNHMNKNDIRRYLFRGGLDVAEYQQQTQHQKGASDEDDSVECPLTCEDCIVSFIEHEDRPLCYSCYTKWKGNWSKCFACEDDKPFDRKQPLCDECIETMRTLIKNAVMAEDEDDELSSDGYGCNNSKAKRRRQSAAAPQSNYSRQVCIDCIISCRDLGMDRPLCSDCYREWIKGDVSKCADCSVSKGNSDRSDPLCEECYSTR